MSGVGGLRAWVAYSLQRSAYLDKVLERSRDCPLRSQFRMCSGVKFAIIRKDWTDATYMPLLSGDALLLQPRTRWRLCMVRSAVLLVTRWPFGLEGRGALYYFLFESSRRVLSPSRILVYKQIEACEIVALISVTKLLRLFMSTRLQNDEISLSGGPSRDLILFQAQHSGLSYPSHCGVQA